MIEKCLRILCVFVLMLAIMVEKASAANAPERGAYAITGVGARDSAFGEAFVAIADDANAILWNPAALSYLLQQWEITFSHINLLPSGFVDNPLDYRIKQDFIGFIYPNDILDCGLSILLLGTNDIIEADKEGCITNWNRGYAEKTFTLSLSRKFHIPKKLILSTGLNFDVFLLNAINDGSGFGGDVGLYIKTPSKKCSVGLMWHGGSFFDLPFVSDSKPVIPSQTDFALAYKHNKCTLAFGSSGHIAPTSRFSLAVEYSWSRSFSTFISYKFRGWHRNSSGTYASHIFTPGFTYRFRGCKIDYSYEYHSGLRRTHWFTLSVSPRSPASFHANSHFKKGKEYYELKHIDQPIEDQTRQAIEEFNKALEFDEKPEFYYLLGLAYERYKTKTLEERLYNLNEALNMLGKIKNVEKSNYFQQNEITQEAIEQLIHDIETFMELIRNEQQF